MLLTIMENIDFSQDKSADVEIHAEVRKHRQDRERTCDISWDESNYSDDENDRIATVAHMDYIYHRFFKMYDEEMKERLIESNI